MIVGQRELVRHTLICLLASSHALLEGVPGLGKTMLVRTLADVLDCTFTRVQFTPDLMPADITGTNILIEEGGAAGLRVPAGPDLREPRARRRDQPRDAEDPVGAARGDAGAPGHRRRNRYPLEQPFFVLATQNPLEMEGTYPLPEAQLDRFLFKLMVPFPTEEDLIAILDRTTGADAPHGHAGRHRAEIIQMQRLARDVPIARHVTATRSASSRRRTPTTGARPACPRVRPLRRLAARRAVAGAGGQDPRPDRGSLQRLRSTTSARSRCPRCATA